MLAVYLQAQQVLQQGLPGVLGHVETASGSPEPRAAARHNIVYHSTAITDSSRLSNPSPGVWPAPPPKHAAAFHFHQPTFNIASSAAANHCHDNVAAQPLLRPGAQSLLGTVTSAPAQVLSALMPPRHPSSEPPAPLPHRCHATLQPQQHPQAPCTAPVIKSTMADSHLPTIIDKCSSPPPAAPAPAPHPLWPAQTGCSAAWR